MREPSLEAVFGGTFNPIHNGHLRSAQALFDVLPIRHLRFVPAAVPPHREAPSVTAEHRAAMVELAIAGDVRLSCDRRELARPGPSYTVDTLESLRAELPPGTPLGLVMGCDALLGLMQWHRWERLLDLAHVVAMARPGWAFPEAGPIGELLRDRRAGAGDLGRAPAGRVCAVTLEPWPVSATRIRALLQSGADVSALVPAAVVAYATAHGLYGSRHTQHAMQQE